MGDDTSETAAAAAAEAQNLGEQQENSEDMGPNQNENNEDDENADSGSADDVESKNSGGFEVIESGKTPPTKMQLSETDIQEFREIFNLVDADGSGAISTDELAQLVESVGMKMSVQELQEMINELDSDQSGEIEVDEFVAVLCKDLAIEYPPEQIHAAFKTFARGAPDGMIRMSDLEEALRVYLRKGNQSEIYTLLKQFEDCQVYLSQVVDSDGMPVPFFRYSDYINLMTKKP